MATIATYRQFGGVHPETAALANALAASGVSAPHTGKPFSEAMILGIGGGLGAGYILWEFKLHRKEHSAKVLVLAFRNRWQYPVPFLQDVCDRLVVSASCRETGSRAAAAKELRAAVERDIPVIAWVDAAHMPYLQIPEVMKGHFGHVVAVCGMDDFHVLVDDLAGRPFRVAHETFADARSRIGSYKNRLLMVEPSDRTVDLPAAIMAGLRGCVEHLSQPSDSFSLPTIRKWGRMMTDTKHAKGWPVLFKDGYRLYGTLISLFEGVRLANNDSGALRGLYADFLDEAAPIVDLPALAEIAEQYRALAGLWSGLADAALPDDVAPLKETRTLLLERHRLLMAHGDEAIAETGRLTERLAALRAEYNRAFPLDAAAMLDLFGELKQRLMLIYQEEMAVNAALGRVLA